MAYGLCDEHGCFQSQQHRQDQSSVLVHAVVSTEVEQPNLPRKPLNEAEGKLGNLLNEGVMYSLVVPDNVQTIVVIDR